MYPLGGPHLLPTSIVGQTRLRNLSSACLCRMVIWIFEVPVCTAVDPSFAH